MTAQDRAIAQSLARVRNSLTAVRAFCIQCMGGYVHLVPDCTAPKCPLFEYRMGVNPKAKARGNFFRPDDSSAPRPAISVSGEPSCAIQQTGEGTT